MGRFNHAQNGFDAGELSPKLHARTDLELYKRGARTLKNFYVNPEGVAMRRPGSKYVKATQGSGAARLIPFVYSQTESYVVELVNGAIRVIRTSDETVITPSEGAAFSYYTAAQAKEVQFTQSADTLFMVHPDVEPQKLRRTAANAFTLESIRSGISSSTVYLVPPLRAVTQDGSGITMTSSVTTGTGTLTASAAFFNAGHVGAYFRLNTHDGWCVVTGFTSSTLVNITVLEDFAATTADSVWYESSWSTYRGWPRTVCFFDDRLVYGGNSDEPDTIWFSKTGVYNQHHRVLSGASASDAFAITLNSRQVNQVQWLMPQRVLNVGTLGAEWRIIRSDPAAAISATNWDAMPQTEHGSQYVQAQSANGAALFVSKDGVNIREFLFNFETDAYVAENLSVGADHLVTYKINETAWQSRYAILWCIDNFSLIGLTRDRSQKVRAWHQHVLGGSLTGSTNPRVHSIAIVPYDTGSVVYEELWVVVSRTINSSTVHYIERMTFELGYYADSYKVISGTSATLTGLNHLEGQTVKTLVDGAMTADETVSGNQITVDDTPTTTAVVGLNNTPLLRTLRPDPPTAIGSSQGSILNVDRLVARFYNTQYAKAGSSESGVELVDFIPSAMDTAPPQFSGDKEIPFTQTPDIDMSVYVTSDQPLALNVAGLFYRGQVSDA